MSLSDAFEKGKIHLQRNRLIEAAEIVKKV